VFSLLQIAISAAAGAVLAYVVVLVDVRRTGMPLTTVDSLLIAATVGPPILLWREASNTL
jgi:hypothetical protein